MTQTTQDEPTCRHSDCTTVDYKYVPAGPWRYLVTLCHSTPPRTGGTDDHGWQVSFYGPNGWNDLTTLVAAADRLLSDHISLQRVDEAEARKRFSRLTGFSVFDLRRAVEEDRWRLVRPDSKSRDDWAQTIGRLALLDALKGFDEISLHAWRLAVAGGGDPLQCAHAVRAAGPQLLSAEAGSSRV